MLLSRRESYPLRRRYFRERSNCGRRAISEE
jgi:hypothetical protein